MKQFLYLITAVILATTFVGCEGASPNTVVVYTALDEIYSKPILDAFTQETGIAVQAVYDTEAAKTTGLVTRLINETNRPRCDVFWNNEVAQTILLKDRGILEAYAPVAAQDIPAPYKDGENFWTGFAARARVLIYNTDQIEDPPTSIHDFLRPEYRGKCAVALPLFGTTATHAAALFSHWGDAKALDFFRALKENEVAFVAGNGVVRDAVARGEYAFGLTDTDDANGAMEDGLPTKWLLPDQDALGTLLIPNTVALVKGSPNPTGGQQLIEYLLSPAVESRLAQSRSIQIPLNPKVEVPENVPSITAIRRMPTTFEEMAAHMESTARQLRELLVK